jgi:hypothetical protein
MNRTRGLIRLWLVVSIIWIAFIALATDFGPAANALVNGAPTESEIAKQQAAYDPSFDACVGRGGDPVECLAQSKPIGPPPATPAFTYERAASVVKSSLALGFGLPLALLAMGTAVIWIRKGFVPKP